MTLEEYWIRAVQARRLDEVEDHEELSVGVDKDTLAKAGKICRRACEVLIQVAKILHVSVVFFRLTLTPADLSVLCQRACIRDEWHSWSVGQSSSGSS